MRVFKEAGYVLTAVDTEEMVLDKKEGALSTLVWGGWDRQGVWRRARLHFSQPRMGIHRIEGALYRLEARGDRLMESEQGLSSLHGSSLQRLLERVKAEVEADDHGTAETPTPLKPTRKPEPSGSDVLRLKP